MLARQNRPASRVKPWEATRKAVPSEPGAPAAGTFRIHVDTGEGGSGGEGTPASPPGRRAATSWRARGTWEKDSGGGGSRDTVPDSCRLHHSTRACGARSWQAIHRESKCCWLRQAQGRSVRPAPPLGFRCSPSTSSSVLRPPLLRRRHERSSRIRWMTPVFAPPPVCHPCPTGPGVRIDGRTQPPISCSDSARGQSSDPSAVQFHRCLRNARATIVETATN